MKAPTAGKIMVARLFEKTSGAGNRYFAGRLGAARCLLFAAGINPESGDPEWHLFVQDGSEAPTPPAVAAPGNFPTPKGGKASPGARKPTTKRKRPSSEAATAARAWTVPEWSPPK